MDTHHSLVFRFLLDRRFHWLRYASLCLALLVFSISEISFNYNQLLNSDTNELYFILLITNCFMCKILLFAVLVKVLVPHILNRGRYGFFILNLLSFSLLFVVIQYVIEGVICSGCNITSRYSAPLSYIVLDAIVLNMQWFIVVTGILVGICIKRMAHEKQLNQQQQAEKLQMESAMIKQQISPQTLCTTLHTCGERAQSDAEATSAALLQFSKVLRYQLYDSRRELSLLKSEIDFVREYLAVLLFDGICKSFTINAEGSIMGVMVPPLIFTSLMQYSEPVGNIDCHFEVNSDNLRFTLSDGRTYVDFSTAHKRLLQLYGNRYLLTISNFQIYLTIPIS